MSDFINLPLRNDEGVFNVVVEVPRGLVIKHGVHVENQPDPKNHLRIPLPPVMGKRSEAPRVPVVPTPVVPSAATSTPASVAAASASATAAADVPLVPPGGPLPVEQLSTVDLIKHITTEVGHLVGKQIELAKMEVKADLKREAVMVGGLSVAAIAGLCTLNLLLVTVVLALATVLPGWLAGLIVSGGTLLATGGIAWLAWSNRVASPLARTQRTLKEDVQWTKERLV